MDIQSSYTPNKRKGEFSNKTEAKRRTIDLETKIEMVKQSEKGVKISIIAQTLGFSKSTVSSILKDKERILAAEKDPSRLKSLYIRQEMEKQLIAWIEEQSQNQVALSLKTIQAKACSLFKEIKQKHGSDCGETFSASQGWFYRFKKRSNLNDIISCSDVGDVDLKACEEIKDTLEKLVTTENYLPEQIFTLCKTVLFLKRMPEATCFQQGVKYMPSVNTQKDRVTLLFGTNVVGYKLKPLLVYHSENPRAFRNVDKTTLPVHYRSNTNSWISQEMFEDWFLNCFVSELNSYCAEKKIPFKILLTLDTLPFYPQHLNDLNPNIKIVFLPKGTSGPLQPMNHGAIAIFKTLYIRDTFIKAVSATERTNYTLSNFWRDYNILHAITNINTAWQDLSEVCLRGIWKNIFNSSFLNLTEEFVKAKEMETICNRIIKLAEELHLEMMAEDIHVVVDVGVDENINEDSMKTENEDSENNESNIEAPKMEIEEEKSMNEQVSSDVVNKQPEFDSELDTAVDYSIKQEKIEIKEYGDMQKSTYQRKIETEKYEDVQKSIYQQDIINQSGPTRTVTAEQAANEHMQFGQIQQFPVERMYTAFSKIKEGLDMFKKMDANFSRYAKVEYLVQKALTVYTDLYRENKKQSSVRHMYHQGPH